MIQRSFNNVLVRPADLEPSAEGFEVVGAFNPGAVAVGEGEEVVLLVRVAEAPSERRAGYIALPRWDPEAGRAVVDWEKTGEWELVDPRVARRKTDGILRLTFLSHLRVVRSPDGRVVDSFDGARFHPSSFGPDGEMAEFETYGVEDPRLTRFSGIADAPYYFTYVAVSPHGAAAALASTSDFRDFKRHGVIFPPENKDVVLFPEKIDGLFRAFHRPNPNSHFAHPEMWLSRSSDLVHWGGHQVFQGAGGGDWASGRIGGGCPPVRTDRGWLVIYHGNQRPTEPGEVGAYSAGALLLDARDPHRLLARSADPILVPETDFEKEGFVRDVVFPTAAVKRGDSLLVYYGAADTCTAVVELSVSEILDSLTAV